MNIKYLSEWENDLIWCPSQLTRKFKDPNTGKVLELYCRWRHCDPWSFSIISSTEWIDLDFALTEYTPIPEVHVYAENLLLSYYKGEKQ